MFSVDNMQSRVVLGLRAKLDELTQVAGPLSSECGTHKTVKAVF
jgi:hypothetical protein